MSIIKSTRSFFFDTEKKNFFEDISTRLDREPQNVKFLRDLSYNKCDLRCCVVGTYLGLPQQSNATKIPENRCFPVVNTHKAL